MAFDNLRLAIESFNKRDPDLAAEVVETEHMIDYLKKEITAYLTNIRSKDLSLVLSIEKLGLFFQMVNDIERISNHAEI